MTTHSAGDVIAGRYRLDGVLGRGGFAITWRGLDRQTDQPVALKELAIRAVEQWRAIELFEREARVLKNLDHPHIPAYVDFIAPASGDDAFVLVQGLAPGSSLADQVKAGWRATEADARDIARQVLETLVYLHGFSPPVVHRDLKPQNLIRDDAGKVMVVDFGAVRDTLATESELGSVAGTFGYMAPEQFAGQALPASDLYGLGATLVHILSHRAPSELPQRELRLDFRPFVQVSPAFARFLERLLEPAPERRFASAKAALEALDKPDVPAPKRQALSPRVRIDTTDDRMVVSLEDGKGGQANIIRVGFSFVWLIAVGFWTTTAISMEAPIFFPLFSIPFWLVGLGMLWGGLRRLSVRTRIELSRSGLVHERLRFGLRTSRKTTALDDIVDLTNDSGVITLHRDRDDLQLAELVTTDAEALTPRLREHLGTLRTRS
jgi:serine/threonine protein kinase